MAREKPRRTIGSHVCHEIAEAFPLEQLRLDELADDIQLNGLLYDIWLYEGEILDGRHRYLACLQAKVEPRFRDYTGQDPVGFAWSMNGARRDLQGMQRALVLQRLQTINRRRAKLVDGIRANRTQRSLPVISEDMDAVKQAQADGTPELIQAMEDGTVLAHQAAAISQLEPDVQRKVLEDAAKPREAVRARPVADAVMMSVAVEHSPMAVEKIKMVVRALRTSVHGELKGAVLELLRSYPWAK